ncbi:MAG: DUF4124 domain-containing protein [Pseudomonadota bacterium]
MLRIVCCISLCLVASHALAAEGKIYRTVDANGNVVFTDVPPKDQTDAVQLSPGTNYRAPTAPRAIAQQPERATASEDSPEYLPEEVGYSQLSIVSPANDEAVRENAGNLTIQLQVSPAWDATRGHSIQVFLDGTLVQTSASTRVTLANIDRGTHGLSARILSGSGEVLANATPITFHMLRHSVLFSRPAP